MSIKNNAFVAVAGVALGLTVSANASPICEGLLNDVVVHGFAAAEVNTAGKVLVLVTVDGEIRPVADSYGNVRLYTNIASAVARAKSSNLASGVQVKYVKMTSTAAVSDPVVALKSKYKKFKAELLNSSKQVATLAAKMAAAEALGWDAATGTPEGNEYADYLARQASIDEWDNYNAAKVSALAGSLTAAGINPDTVV